MNSVSHILKVNFLSLPLDKQLKIKELGRPMPELTLTQLSERKGESRTFTRHFSTDTYYRNNWICGCDVSNLLYCFPCLLLYTTGMDSNWARQGIKDLHHLPSKMRKHESSRGHINACTGLAVLGKANLTQANLARKEQVAKLAKHNENVTKNRYILKRIIRCLKFCSVELGLTDESEELDNRGVFRELIDFTAELDVTLKEHLQNATAFKGISKTIQNDIFNCMLAVCREEISQHIEKSDFLSIQCDEITDVSKHHQMVLILRYVYEGSIYENFWKFLRIQDKTAEGLTDCIRKEIDPLISNSPQKLIAQTYDGGNVMSGSIGGVQTKIRGKYPHARFIHCYTHQLHLIVQKSASQNSSVRLFFSKLSAIPAFFSSSAHRSNALECRLPWLKETMKIKLPKVAATRWDYDLCTINVVYENRDKLAEIFKEVEEKCVDSVDASAASGLRSALQDPDFIFWLTFFQKITPLMLALYSQSKNKNDAQFKKDMSMFKSRVFSIGIEHYDIQKSSDSNFKNVKRERVEDTLRTSINIKEVCDIITTQMNDRFSYRGHLQAATLLNYESFPRFSKTFPVDVLTTVTSFYPMLSDTKLKTELEVIYLRPDFRGIVGTPNILTFLLENDLAETFTETTKLLKIILTTPMATTESGRCFPTLKRINTCIRNSKINDRLEALAMMSVNKNLVRGIKNFEDKVMEKFILIKDRRGEFNFKK